MLEISSVGGMFRKMVNMFNVGIVGCGEDLVVLLVKCRVVGLSVDLKLKADEKLRYDE